MNKQKTNNRFNVLTIQYGYCIIDTDCYTLTTRDGKIIKIPTWDMPHYKNLKMIQSLRR
jgi:hypothetical protein